MLYNEKELFERLILDTSEHFGIVPVIIEKDYYVTIFLKEITKRQPNIVFRGGTSLSKCYKLINRFSEDIDLGVAGNEKPTEGQRKCLVTNIKGIIDEYGFELTNPQEIRSRRDFNRFDVNVRSLFASDFVKHDLIIETAVFTPSYPSVKKDVMSYVGEYLKYIGRNDVIELYDLKPFEMQVQAVERTFIDKIFAVCDYYLSGEIDEHSRHLYDLYKMSAIVSIDEDLKELLSVVRNDRKTHKTCLSASDGFDIKACLKEIIDKDVYKNDFETITIPLIFEDVSYEAVICSIKRILDSVLFD